MKRPLLLLAIICLLVAPVLAVSYNFQNPDDFTHITTWSSGTCGITSLSHTWSESTTGGNNYVNIWAQTTSSGSSYNYAYILPNAYPMTYSAATYLSGSGSSYGPGLFLLGASKNILYSVSLGNNGMATTRMEIKMSGMKAYVYEDGVLFATSGTLAQNPAYIGWGEIQPTCGYGGNTKWDNIVWGSDDKRVLAFPESTGDAFYIQRDITNPAASGLYNGTSGTQVNANYTSGFWSRGDGSVPPSALANESIDLVNYFDNTVYATNYTGTDYLGTATFDVTKYLINNASAPMGYYALHIPGTTVYSNPILYKSNGASVVWSSKHYNTGDTGTVIYYVMSGGYWDTANYNYQVSILDFYGNFKSNTTISTSSGSVTYSWSSSDNPGIYLAWLIATEKTTGKEYILGSDYTELSGYVSFSGYVNNETANVLSGANVSIVQGLTEYDLITSADGSYATTGTSFVTGSYLTFNITATGYSTYNVSFVPPIAKSVLLNLTLNSTAPAYTGLGIGGVVRDGILTGNILTSGYGNPIIGATCYAKNTSAGQLCSNVTNVAAWYQFDETNGCILTTKQPYDVWCNKAGFSNSQNYTVVAA